MGLFYYLCPFHNFELEPTEGIKLFVWLLELFSVMSHLMLPC